MLFWKETLHDIYQESKKAIITGAGYQMLCYQYQIDIIFSISYLKKYKYVSDFDSDFDQKNILTAIFQRLNKQL